MLLGHSASAPFFGASLHWWHGLPSVHLAGVAPLGAGFVTGNVGQWLFSLELATREEGLPLGSLVLVPGRWHSVMVVVVGKAGVRSYCPNTMYFRFL